MMNFRYDSRAFNSLDAKTTCQPEKTNPQN